MANLWSKVKKTSSCWLWTGGKDKDGYGVIWANGKCQRVHRYLYQEQHKLKLKPWQYVCHKCDNVQCCNPEHMFIGTAFDNLKDAMAKGRFNQKGSKNTNAKLTEKLVYKIRTKYITGKYLQKELAEEFGVTLSTLNQVVTGKTWRHA